jgi:Holliday junction resolvase RusA-like endonuclease
MPDFSVAIPGNPPALNSTYKVVTIKGRGRLAKHSAVSVWQDSVAWLTRAAKPADWQPSRRVRVEVSWYAARKRDADAGLKALLDGLAVGLGIDDACFLPTILLNEVDKTDPRTLVTIRCESLSDRLTYGDILALRPRGRKATRVQFIRYAKSIETPGKPGQWFWGLTVKGDPSAVRRGQIGRIDLFPEGGWIRDE